jgi:putative hydrolase of the HAD superfamily
MNTVNFPEKGVVFFDMGNTLLHFHYGESDDEKDMKGLLLLTEYLKSFNASIMFEEVKQEFYDKWMDGIKDRKLTYVEYPIEAFLNNFLQKFGFSLSIEQCIEAINLFYTDYREQVYYENSVYDTLKLIRSKGYKIGVISNTCYYDEVMKECFKKAKIYDLVDSFTFSYSLRIGKPNKQIFKTAMEVMKISSDKAIMVGDSLESDIKPALALGIKTIWLNYKNSTIKSDIKPDIEIVSLSELPKYI